MKHTPFILRSLVASLTGVLLMGQGTACAADGKLTAQEQVLQDISAGRTARPAIERLQADGAVGLASPTDHARGAEARQLGTAQAELTEVLQKLIARPADEALWVQAANRYDDWRAAVLLVTIKFDRAGQRLKGSAEGSAYVGRHERASSQALKALAQVQAVLDPVLANRKGAQASARGALQSALALLQKLPTSLHEQPILRANTVPFGTLNLPPRQPVLTPALTPSYERVTETAPEPADHAATALAPLSDEVIAQATSLNNDYVKIYEYVRNSVRTQWYAGAVKGATGVLRSRSGNDIDQATLLTALLRAAGLDTHYVQGVVELPVERVAADLGLAAADAGLVPAALSKAGIAFTPVNRGGRVAAVQVAHTWVSANVPYTNYRGALVDASGKTWIPLDPAYKTVNVTASTGYFGRTFTSEALVNDYLAKSSSQNFGDFVRQKVQSTLSTSGVNASWSDQRATAAIQPLQLSILPNSLPYAVTAVTYEATDLPASDKATLRILVRQGAKASDPIALEQSVPLADAVASRVTLSYGPASVEDHRVSLLYGGMDAVPLYLIGLRPQIKVGGTIVNVGTGQVEPGAALRLELKLIGPWGEQEVDQTVVAGAYHAFVASNDPTHPAVVANADGEFNGARLLDGLGTYYASQWNSVDADLAALLDVGVVRPVPALTVVSTTVKPSLVAGVPVTLEWTGVNIDAALRPVDAVGTRAADFLKLSALAGSSNESAIFRDQFSVDAISADRGIQLAAEQGLPILKVDSASAGQIDATTHPDGVKTAVRDLARQGFTVQLPSQPITINAWSGSVWRATNKAGQAGYFLAGGLAGGETDIPPDQWPLGFLADAFRSMQTEAANNDPRSGASVQIVGAGDGQRVQVGKPFATPLAVTVRDSLGRPVNGAPVTFSVITGDANLGGSQSQTVTTNVLGMASMQATMGTSTAVNPGWTKLKTGDESPTRVGYITIDVSVDSASGPLHPSSPFAALGLPGPISEIRRTSPAISTGYAGLLADQLIVAAGDQYSNPIANQSINATISTAGACSGGQLKQGAVFDSVKDCKGKEFLSSCGSPSVSVTTKSDGIVFIGVLLGNDMGAMNTVTTSSSGISRQFTYQALEGCTNITPKATLVWRGGRIDGEGNDVAAVKPGDKYPEPVEVVFYRDDLAYTIDAGPKLRFLPFRDSVMATGKIDQVAVNDGGAGEDVQSSGSTGSYKIRSGNNPRRYNSAIRTTVTMPIPRLESGQVVIRDRDVQFDTDGASIFAVTSAITSVKSKDAPGAVDPNRVYLDGSGVSLYPIEVAYKINPEQYVTPMPLVQLLANGAEDDYAVGNKRSAAGQAILPRAKAFDRAKNYEAKLVLPIHDSVTLDSEPFSVPIRQKLIEAMSPVTKASRQVDAVNRRVCERPGGVTFQLTQDAMVTLSYQMLGAGGELLGTPQDLITNQPYPTGRSTFQIDTAAMGNGQFQLTLKATSVSDPSVTDQAQGALDVRYQIANSLPVGQILVKGVNVRSGSLTYQTDRLNIPGRGPAFDFATSYSSAAAGNISTTGANWTHNFDLGLQVNSCGEASVSAGDSGSVRFFPKGDGTLAPDKGYHGTLIANHTDNTWDFYSKDGTRYHYKFFNQRVQWKIDTITDRNGNTQTFEYDLNAFPDPLLSKVKSSDGREYSFKYDRKVLLEPFRVNQSSAYADGTSLLSQVSGPGGTRANLSYDDLGNLVSYEVNGRAQSFTYSTELPRIEDRYRMLAATDARGKATRYTFGQNTLTVTPQNAQTINLEQFAVSQMTTPLDGTLKFEIDPLTWSTATVTNELGGRTSYTFNNYGNPLTIADEAGTTTMTWASADVLMLSKQDARGILTSYDYDSEGNVKRETVGGYSTDSVYEIQTAAPFSKTRLKQKTDRNGKVYQYDYDDKGNLITETLPESVVVRHSYAGNGDRLSTTDGRGKATRFEYDAYGNIAATLNPIGARTETPRDPRGRVTSSSDGNGNTTTFTYDNQDNLLRQKNALGGERVATFDATGNKLSETDEAGGANTWTYNAANQPLTMGRTGPDGRSASKTLGYDAAGNKTSETDWLGRATTYTYDKLSRLTLRTEPLGKTTGYEYDPVGNLKVETDALSRQTRHDYDDLNRRTATTDALSNTWRYGYDGNGNRTSTTDPRNPATTMVYDGLNRLTQVKQPLGRNTTNGYDASGNKTSETDPNGNVTTHEYDGANRLVSTKKADNTTIGYLYDLANNLTQQTDEGNGVTLFAYDALNRKLSAKDPEGQITRYGYDPLGNLTAETWANNNALAHSYDLFNRRTTTSDSIGAVGSWVYDNNGNLASETDARGNQTTHTYNALNQRTDSSLPGGRTLHFKPDLLGNVLESTDARSNKTVTVYDDLNRVKQITYADGGIAKTTYDSAGNKETQTDALGNLTRYHYDNLNRVQDVTDPLSKFVAYQYDLVGNKTQETDKRGTVSAYTYDAVNRLLSTTKAGIGIQTLTYTPLGKVATQADANGNLTSIKYDKRGLQTEQNAPEGATTLQQRDAMGDVVQTTDPEGRLSKSQYDARRRLVKATNGAGEATQYEYDLANHKTATVRPSGARTEYVFDQRNFMTQVKAPLASNTQYGYDANGNLISLTDANSHTTNFDHDKLNRRISITYPGGASESFAYDAAGNLKTHFDANGISVTRLFDALNRETSKTFSGSADNLGNIGTTYDANGNRLSVTETYTGASAGTRVSTFTYDAFDRQLTAQDAFGAKLSFAYDANGNRKTLTTQDGKVTRYGYDKLNRLVSLVAPGNGGVNYRHDKSGLVVQQDWQNGDSTKTSFDAAERPLSITLSQNGEPLNLIEYTYDLNGNRLQERANRLDGAQLTTYGYDASDRLTSTQRTDDTARVNTTWTYDGVDNRLSETVTTTSTAQGSPSSTVTRGYTYDSRDQLKQITDSAAGTTTLGYDAQGNLLQKVQGGHTTGYIWNARDHLITVSQDGTVLGRYETDHAGLRIQKVALDPLNPQAPPQTTRTLWDELNAVQDRDASGNLLTRYEFASGKPVMLSASSSEEPQYLHADALGSIVATTDTSDGGVVSETQYDAWGNPTAQTGESSNKFAFTGHQADKESGLYYFKARYYDPTTGRFLSQDPAEGKALEPESYHKYLYAYANPLSFTDPTGTVACGGGVYADYCRPPESDKAQPRQSDLDKAKEDYAKNHKYAPKTSGANWNPNRPISESTPTTEKSDGLGVEEAEYARRFGADSPVAKRAKTTIEVMSKTGDVVQEMSCVKNVCAVNIGGIVTKGLALREAKVLYEAAKAARAEKAIIKAGEKAEVAGAKAETKAAAKIEEQEAKEASSTLGGAHRETSKPLNDKLDSHHCPAKDCKN